MRIIKKYITDLSVQERRQVRNLTIESNYGMRKLLSAVLKNPETHGNAYIFMCYHNDKLIAWSCIAPGSFTWTERTELWVYCRRAYRRQGIGTILYKLAKRKLNRGGKRNKVVPWDPKGIAFFKSQGVRV